MTEQNSPTEKPNKLYQLAKSWLPFLAILAVVYFGNVELQSYLGRKALQETGLELLSIDEATAKAKQEGKLVLADMSAIWCPSCRKLDSAVFTDEAVKKAIDAKYVFARVEYESEDGEAFMRRHNVRGFPTLLILDHDGNKVRQLALTFDPQQFITQL